jgi:hypothetical protein
MDRERLQALAKRGDGEAQRRLEVIDGREGPVYGAETQATIDALMALVDRDASPLEGEELDEAWVVRDVSWRYAHGVIEVTIWRYVDHTSPSYPSVACAVVEELSERVIYIGATYHYTHQTSMSERTGERVRVGYGAYDEITITYTMNTQASTEHTP